MSRQPGATPEKSRTAPHDSAARRRGQPARRRGLRRRSGLLLRLLASLFLVLSSLPVSVLFPPDALGATAAAAAMDVPDENAAPAQAAVVPAPSATPTSEPTAVTTSTPTASPTSTPVAQPSGDGAAADPLPKAAEATQVIAEAPSKPAGGPGSNPGAAGDGSGKGAVPLVEAVPTYNVDSTEDHYDGFCDSSVPFFFNCTLREAIVNGNKAGGAIINLPGGVYEITENEPEGNPNPDGSKGDYLIWTPITINGAGAGVTIIQAGSSASNAINRLFTVAPGGNLTLNGVTLRNAKPFGREPGAAILNFDTVTLRDSEVYNATSVNAIVANALDKNSSTVPSMTILRSTIANTTPGEGGGAVNNSRGTMTIANSTIVENRDAIINFGTTTIVNSTIAGNSGAGLLQAGGALTVKNTLLANNNFANCASTPGAPPITSTGHNLSSDNYCAFTSTGGLVKADAKLGPLQHNGGGTRTRALLPGSAALDAGDNAGCAGGAVAGVDQRNSPRPRPDDLACDIGAFELNGPTGSKLAVTQVTGVLGVTANEQFSVTVQAQNSGNRPIPLPAAPLNFTLSVGTGTGALGGTITGQIPAGANSATLSGLTYNAAELGVVLRATPATGSLVAGSSDPFEVLPQGFLEVTDISPPNPLQLRPFSVTVRVKNKFGWDRNVDTATTVVLSVKTGTGVLGGTVSATIPAGQHSVTFSGLTYDKIEGGVVLRAARTSGDGLAPGDSAAFNVDSPNKLVITKVTPASPGVPSSPGAGVGDPFSVTVEAQQDNGAPYHVVTATGIRLKVVIPPGSGVLRGSASTGLNPVGQIAAGDSSVTITGVTYNKAETIQLLPNRDGNGDPMRVIASNPITFHHSLYVNGTSGADASDCLSAGSACKTVGAAIGKAAGGDEIFIAAGVYDENLTISKSLTLQGDGAATTILDGGQRGRVVKADQAGAAITLAGLTIRNGKTSAGDILGGGIYNGSTMTLRNSVVSGNTAGPTSAEFGRGGGIANFGTLTVLNSTISGNNSWTGGGIGNFGTLTMLNSTISSNTGRAAGGAIGSQGTTTVVNSTIAWNQAFGISSSLYWTSGTMTVKRSVIVAQVSSLPDNCEPATISDGGSADGGYNLSNDGSCIADGVNHNIVTGDPRLGPLADNGGPTPTHALLPGSPAINAIPVADCKDAAGAALDADQRGATRPYQAACDIGAVEAGVLLAVTQVNGGNPVVVNTPFDVALTLSEPDGAPHPVTAATNVTLAVQTGTGTLGGTFTGVIPVGQATLTISGVTYSKGDAGVVLSARRGAAGDAFTPGASAPFNVLRGPITLYVDAANGADGNPCDSAASACRTIGAVLGRTMDGDTVQLAAGIYRERFTLDKRLTLQGAGAKTTVLDGGQGGTAVTVTAGVTGAAISGVTIRNGKVNGGLGGGLANHGALTLEGVTISGNSAAGGAGIHNAGGAALTLRGSTVNGNTATAGGGGILNAAGATLSVLNSTLSGNSGGSGGGGLKNSGAASVVSSTITDNAGAPGGVEHSAGTTTLKNSLVAAQQSGGNCAGSVSDGGANLAGSDSACGLTNGVNGAVVTADPKLGPLTDNGGPTLTHTLLPGSPAVDAIPAGGCTDLGGAAISLDQRGTSRPYPSAGACDIGALEATPFLAITVIDPATPQQSAAFAVTVQALRPDGQPYPVSTATQVILSIKAGIGTLGGTTTGQIPAGQSSTVISGVSYSKVESGVRLGAVRGDFGDSVAPGDSAAFAVQQQPARNFAVTKTDDTNDGLCDADCSLREAIVAVNAVSPAEGIITLPAGTYTLTRTGANEEAAATGDLDITGKATINGAGAGSTIIQAGADPTNGIDRVLHLHATGESRLTLDGVSVRFGMTAGSGGGILNDGGSVTLRDSAVSGNTAGGVGGGIAHAGGSLTVENSVLYFNTAQGASGGGIALADGTATVQNSTLSSNSVVGPTGGAGISVAAGASAVIVASTIAGNQNDNGNATGGGVRNDGTVTLKRSLVGRNLQNTGAVQNCAGPIGAGGAGGGYNLSDDSTCFAGGPNNNRVAADVMVGPLAGNGGPTPTLAPLLGSPALEQIPADQCLDAAGEPLTADQRGRERPFPAGGKCDIGALEAGLYLAVTQINPVAPFLNTPFSVTVQAQSADGAAQPVSAATGVRLTLQGAVGTLTGTLTGAIPAGQSSVAIEGLSHDKIEPNLRFTVARTSGDPVFGSDSALFNVRPLPTGYFVNGASGADTNTCLSAALACQTINGALAKALDLDSIQIAAGTYNERLNVDKSVTVQGAGAAQTVVDGQQGGSVIVVAAGKTVSVAGIAIRNGKTFGAPAQGGGIRNLGTLTLRDAVVSGNTAQGDNNNNATAFNGLGGGVYSSGPLTIQNSTVANNIARGGNGGQSCTGSFEFQTCFPSGAGSGHGGGIYLAGGAVTLSGLVVAGNRTSSGSPGSTSGGGFGGGFQQFGQPGEAAGGGAYLAAGSLTVESSTLSGNVANPLILVGATVGGGNGSGGGAFIAGGAATFMNSTVSGNSSIAQDISFGSLVGNGAGFRVNGGSLTLRNVTVTANRAGQGAGITVAGLGSVTAINSVVGGNPKALTASEPVSDCFGTITSQGYNVSSDTTCGFSDASKGDAQGASVRLGPLADNGGATQTHVPLYGSPVLERVPLDQCKDLSDAALTVDQRGRVRPYTAAGKCDSGAVESGPFLVVTQIDPANPIQGRAFNVTVQAQEPDGSPHNVTGESQVALSRAAGTGGLAGVASGTIPAGGHTVVIPSLTYDKIETGVMLAAKRGEQGDANLEAGLSVAFNVLAPPPTQLGVVKLDPAVPFAGAAFKVTVQARDDNWFPGNVLTATDVTLSLKTGTGTLGGTLTGQIPAGQSSVILQGVTYSTAESGVVLTVARGANGDALAASDSLALTFTALPPPDSWGAQTSGVGVTLNGVAALADGQTAWAAGSGAVILKTTDGGATWTAKNSGAAGDILTITAVDSTTLFAASFNGNVYRTTNGGESWEATSTNAGKNLNGVAAFGQSVWAVGTGGFIVYSGDGGATWTVQNSTVGNNLRSVVALSATTAVAVGDSGTVVRTVNGGANWTIGPSLGGSNSLSGVTAFGANTLWASGAGIFRSDDAGVSWTLQPGTSGKFFTNVFAASAATLWATGFSGLIYKTSDGGAGNWSQQTSGTTQQLSGIAAADAENAWAVGGGGIILRTPTKPTKLAIIALDPASPVVGQPFKVTVQAQGPGGGAAPAQADTAVTLSVKSGGGSGMLAGTTTGVIPAGQSAVTIQYLTYDTVEAGVQLTATRTDGDNLTAGDSAAFTVLPPGKLAITAIEPAGPTQSQTFKVTVQAQDLAGAPLNVTAATDVTLSRKTGTGVLAGTLTRTIALGANTVTFDDLTYDKGENGVVLTAARGASGAALRSGDSAAFAVLRRLAGHWPGENNANDASGAGRHGAGSGVTFAAGVVGQAFTLNNASVSVADAADLNPPAQITIAAWVKATSDGRIVDKMTAGGADGYALDLTGGKLRLTIGADTLTSADALPSGRWNHVAGTYDGANLRLYVNGAAAGSAERTGAIPASTLTLLIGKDHSGGSALTGGVDEVRLYTAALPVADIQTLAQAPARALAITALSPSRPVSGQPFAVTVEARDANGAAANVAAPTNVFLTKKTGTGSLTGTASKQIAAGQSSVTFTGMAYSKVENGVALSAIRTSGDQLSTGDSAPFNVTLAANLVVTRVRPSRPAPAPATFTVEVEVQDNNGQPVPVSAATDVALSKKAGAGALGGALSGTIAVGQSSVIITGVTYSQNDTGVQVTAARGAAGDQVGPGDSAALVVSSTPLTLSVTGAADGHDAQPGDGTCATATGECALRAAIEEANESGAGAVIRLGGQTFTLSDGALTITGDLTFNGEPLVRLVDSEAEGSLAAQSSVSGSAIIQGGEQEGSGTDRVFLVESTGSLTLNNVVVRYGKTNSAGGGVLNSGTLALNGSTVTANTALSAGGIANLGRLIMTDSTVAGNAAILGTGGIDASGGEITIRNSLIAGNSAGAAGGLAIAGADTRVTVQNSTVTGNSAPNGTGGIAVTDGAVKIIASTIAGNTGASGFASGISQTAGTVTVKNSIVAGNTGGDGDCSGTFTSQGHNLEGGASCGFTNTAAGDLQAVTDPKLGPLADNGGPTQTLALLGGSPAVNAVPAADCTDVDGNPLTEDQRGTARPQSGACDIGAYEQTLTPPSFTSASSADFMLGTPGAFTVVAAGVPAPALSVTGSLPSGVTFNAATGVLAGTPEAGTLGQYSLTFTAANGIGADATQTFTLTVLKTATTTTVSGPTNPLAYGQTATFTATVTGPGAGVTGAVTFKDGAETLGTAPLSSGSASFSTATLSAGSHSITAEYGGDANYQGSAGSLTVSIIQAATTAQMTSTAPNPSVFGQPVTLTAAVAAAAPGAAAPTGTVTFKDGATELGTPVALVNGGASLSVAGLSVGAHSITAVYSGDTNYTGATSTATTQTVNQAGAATQVSSTPGATVFGQPAAITATVSAASPGAGTPTGAVTFKEGETVLAEAVSLTNGSASFTTSSLSVGQHALIAVYSGDGSFLTSTSGSFTHTVNQAGVTVGLSATPNPAVLGDEVTLSVTVTAASPGAGTPTGAVTFKDGETVLGTGALSSGLAELKTASLSVGPHTLTAAYAGDGSFKGAASSSVTQTINKRGTTTAVTSRKSPTVYGEAVTLDVTISGAGATPSGTVTFSEGGNTLGSVTLTGGAASFTATALSVGSHTLTAAYSGDGNFNGSSAAVPQTVQQAGATVQVTALTPNPSVLGQQVSITAAAAAAAPGAGTPTGTMIFKDGATALGAPVALVNGSASLSLTSLSLGAHSITAEYSGDGNFTGATSAAATQTVLQFGTVTQVSSAPGATVFGQPAAITATVTVTAPGTGTPTGAVTFKEGETVLAEAVSLTNGSASFTTSSLSVGQHPITAIYGGGGGFVTSTSAPSTHLVNPAATAASLSSPGATVFGQGVTFTVEVTVAAPGAGLPTGSVTLLDGATPFGTVTLNAAGQASFSTSGLAVGQHTITASYAGDASFAGSVSAELTQTVNQAATTTTLSSAPNPSVFPAPVTFTATVAAAAPGAGTPTGTVTFREGTTTLGSGTLDANGQANFAAATLTVGAHSVTASYAGDAGFAVSTAAPLEQTVQPGPAAKYLVSLSNLTPTANGPVTVTAQLADQYGNAVKQAGRTVQWSRSGSAGSFTPTSSPTSGDGAASATFVVSTVVGESQAATATDGDGLTGTSPTLTTIMPVVLRIEPATVTAAQGGNAVEVRIVADTGPNQLDSVQFRLSFDLAKLQIVDNDGEASNGVQAVPGAALSNITQNRADNGAGTLDFRAERIPSAQGPAAGAFVVATVRVRSIEAGVWPIGFAAPQVEAIFGGVTLGTRLDAGTVEARPKRLEFTAQPFRGAGGIALGTQPVVAVRDALGNTVTGENGAVVTLRLRPESNPGGAILRCDQMAGTVVQRTVQSGVAAFTGCVIDRSAAGLVLEASAEAADVAATAGIPFNITVAGDTNGNCLVSVVDVSLVVTHYGKNAAHADWTAPALSAFRADLDGDGRVGVLDFSAVISRFGLGSAPCAAASNPATVSITDAGMTPGSLTVAVGQGVLWNNVSAAARATGADGGWWTSGRLEPGQSFGMQFTAPGVFRYGSALGGTAAGTVTVLPGAAP